MGAILLATVGFLAVQLPVAARTLQGAGQQPATSISGWVGLVATPELTFTLLLVALLGLGLEAVHPGSLVFGGVGVAAGILAVIGLVNQPFDWLGLLLVAMATALLVTDTSFHSHGVLGVAAILLAIAGGLVLYAGVPARSDVSLATELAVPVVAGGIWITLSRRALRVRLLPFASNTHELLGLTAVMRQRADPKGIAAVEGELWRAEARGGGVIEAGTEVEILAQDGLTLIVEPLPLGSAAAGPGADRSSSAAVGGSRRVT